MEKENEEDYNVCIVCGKKEFTAAPAIKGWVCDECYEREVMRVAEEQTTCTDWIDGELAEAEKQRKEFLESKGYKTFYVFQKGVTTFSIDATTTPRDEEYIGKPKKVFAIKVAGVEFEWSLNPRNPVYRDVLRGLKSGRREFMLLCSGDGQNTKFELLEEKKQ